MRFKKGFTLAEVLIVLMIIGALATMTIPSLMKGVTEAQFKTAYRKGLNTIVNLTVMEKLSGNLPSQGGDKNACILFDTLTSNLSAKAYLADDTTTKAALDAGSVVTTGQLLTKAPTRTVPAAGCTYYKNWIVTDDNLAYLITTNAGGTNCKTKSGIVEDGVTITTYAPDTSACFIIWVDVNGLTAGPNSTINNAGGGNAVASAAKMEQIVQDQFPIFLGIDGATAGNPVTTVTGRISADLK